MDRDDVIRRIVELVFALSNELEAVDDANPNDLWPLHPDREPTDRFKLARPYADEIVSLVRQWNGAQLSDHVILSRLIYGAAAIRIQLKISDDELRERAERNAADLIDYRATRQVDVPVLSLDLHGEPFKFGPVTFHPIGADDKETDWWKWAKSTLQDLADGLFLSYARIIVPGDPHRSVENAAAIVGEALLILRGVGFPLVAEERQQIGIINEFPMWRNVPYRLGHPKETTRVDAQTGLVMTTGAFKFPYNLKRDILSGIPPEKLQVLLSLVDSGGLAPTQEMHARVLSGFRWLGEATKPDALAARFAKVAFSLEAFVGGDAKDDMLSARGITAALAERTAFLVSDDPEARIKVDKDVRRFYSTRSGIAHGRRALASPSDFEEFGGLVRTVGVAILGRLDEFRSIDELQHWVTIQRYS